MLALHRIPKKGYQGALIFVALDFQFRKRDVFLDAIDNKIEQHQQRNKERRYYARQTLADGKCVQKIFR